MKRDASEDCGTEAPNALWVREFSDRPRASRSNTRFSSWLNSCSSVRTPLLSIEVASQRQVSLPRALAGCTCSPITAHHQRTRPQCTILRPAWTRSDWCKPQRIKCEHEIQSEADDGIQKDKEGRNVGGRQFGSPGILTALSGAAICASPSLSAPSPGLPT